MALGIYWSPRALKRFHAVINYLEKNWGKVVVEDFVKRTELLLQTLAIQPKMFRSVSKTQDIREAVFTKHNLMIYKIAKEKIILLTFFDSRQHPKKKLRES